MRASAEALYDHRAKMARFSLTLTEALLFERVHLTGGAALLIRWGDRNEFAMTLGGFHPSFRPFIPEGLREPPRLGAYWKPHRLVELSIKAYFALTSTSLQFGFAAHVEAGASWGGFRADTEFNFLVMTEPDIRFELDLSFRVTVFLFGCDLISASLSGAISGPGPWTMEGSVYWEVCGVDISKDFGPYEWGDSPPQLGDPAAGSATGARRCARRGRELDGPAQSAAGGAIATGNRRRAGSARSDRHPADASAARRRARDARREPVVGSRRVDTAAGDRRIDERSRTSPTSFPTRRYLQRPPKETPFRGGLDRGCARRRSRLELRDDLAIESDESITEDLVLDSLPVRPQAASAQRLRPDYRRGSRRRADAIDRAQVDAAHADAGGRAMKLVLSASRQRRHRADIVGRGACAGVGRCAPRITRAIKRATSAA